MEDVKLVLNNEGRGGFFIKEDNRRIGEMIISIADDELTVYHTEVAPEAEGKGLAKKMLEKMVSYAREHKMKVIALCPFVHAQFMRHEANYADIWKK